MNKKEFTRIIIEKLDNKKIKVEMANLSNNLTFEYGGYFTGIRGFGAGFIGTIIHVANQEFSVGILNNIRIGLAMRRNFDKKDFKRKQQRLEAHAESVLKGKDK